MSEISEPTEQHEAELRKKLEDLEDALEHAIKCASKVHINVTYWELGYLMSSGASSGRSETVGELLVRARGPVRERLNAVYASEVRKNRAR